MLGEAHHLLNGDCLARSQHLRALCEGELEHLADVAEEIVDRSNAGGLQLEADFVAPCRANVILTLEGAFDALQERVADELLLATVTVQLECSSVRRFGGHYILLTHSRPTLCLALAAEMSRRRDMARVWGTIPLGARVDSCNPSSKSQSETQ